MHTIITTPSKGHSFTHSHQRKRNFRLLIRAKEWQRDTAQRCLLMATVDLLALSAQLKRPPLRSTKQLSNVWTQEAAEEEESEQQYSGKVNLHVVYVYTKNYCCRWTEDDYEEEEEDQKSARINGVGRCCILSQWYMFNRWNMFWVFSFTLAA